MQKTKTTERSYSLYGNENRPGCISLGRPNECDKCHKPLRKGKNCWYCANTSYEDEHGNVDVCPLWGQSVNIFSDSGEEREKNFYQNN